MLKFGIANIEYTNKYKDLGVDFIEHLCLVQVIENTS